MNIEIILHKSPPVWWNREIKKNNGFFCSTSHWGDLFEKLSLGQAKYLEVKINSDRVILVLIYDVLLGASKLIILPRLILKFFLLFPFLRSYNMLLQPVIVNSVFYKNKKYRLQITEEMIKYIFELSGKEGKSIFPANYICFNKISEVSSIQKMLSFKNEIKVIKTVRLDIRNNSIKFVKEVSPNRDIKFCEAKGDVLNKYFDILYNNRLNNNIDTNPTKYYIEIQKLFPRNIKYFVLYINNQISAGTGLLIYGKTILEFARFVINSNNLFINDLLLQKEVIKYAKVKRIKILDFNSTFSGDRDGVGDNIDLYKNALGGTELFGVKIAKYNIFSRFLTNIFS